MISTGHKPRGWTEDELAADHRLRLAVRRFLRAYFPDLQKPPGTGWVIAVSEHIHPPCGRLMLAVKVPGVDAPGLGYCPECNGAGLHQNGSYLE